jgi:hypothetical protein
MQGSYTERIVGLTLAVQIMLSGRDQLAGSPFGYLVIYIQRKNALHAIPKAANEEEIAFEMRSPVI